MAPQKGTGHSPVDEGGSCCSSTSVAGGGRSSCCAPKPTSQHLAIDPVCAMEVDRAAAPGGSLRLGGETHFFCSTFCRAKFAASAGLPQKDGGGERI